MNIVKVETYQGELYHIFSFCSDDGTSELDNIAEKIDHSQIKQIYKLDLTIKKAALHTPSSLAPERCHNIEDKIWQFRADDIRVLWFYDKGKMIICTHGFIKKTNKTPRKQIEKAKQKMAEYFAAKMAGQLNILEERDE